MSSNAVWQASLFKGQLIKKTSYRTRVSISFQFSQIEGGDGGKEINNNKKKSSTIGKKNTPKTQKN